jgi:hypothetical protein
MGKIKIKNNADKVIEVTQEAWDVLYKNRDGFSLYKEKSTKKKTKTVSKKSPKKEGGKNDKH